jgi:hypothetical protein
MRRYGRLPIVLLVTTLFLIHGNTALAGLHPSYSEKAVVDTVPFYKDGKYDPSVPHPNDFLEHPLGQWPQRYYEMAAYVKVLAESSPRVMLQTRGTTHEGRELFSIFISSPENIANLEKYRTVMDKVAAPDKVTSTAQLDSLIRDLPAFAWLGYSIHGDELSGTDAAVQLAYHLAAANDSATLHLLDNVITIIDPCENPDGRERYLSMLQTYKSAVPNYDNSAMQHRGVWPWGRGNHYLFDLNRDCILVNQPETPGKLATIQKWHPVLTVDAHEMGANATYLFSPPREPINYNTPPHVRKWYDVYQKDQAAAFDRRGWPYYSGEWNDQWYPGYTSAWPTFFGAIGILYEQAGVDGAMVKQRDDYLLTYHEAVNHQFTSSLTNLFTTADNRRELLKDYYQARKKIVEDGRKSRLQFLFVPDGDELKMKRFIESLTAQGIVVQRAVESFSVGSATDIYHTEHKSKTFPAGTYIVNTAQPNGALAKAVLEFDPHFKKEFLEEERRELEKHNRTRMYEVSAWSLPLAYDLDAYATTSSFKVTTETVDSVTLSDGHLVNPEARFGFVVDMEGEKTYRLLARLFGEELIVYAAEKPFTVEGKSFKSGALLLRKRGNREDLAAVLEKLAQEVGITIYGVNTGLSTEGSHLGAPTFRLLAQPKIALVLGDGMDFTSVGSLWFTIDKELHIPHSLIQVRSLRSGDLSKYNVIVIPSSWGGVLNSQLGKEGAKKLERWVRNGGTLVLTGRAAIWAADTTTALSQVRLRRQVLDKLDKYRRQLERELRAEKPPVDTMVVWHPDKVPEEGKAKKAKETKEGKPQKPGLEKTKELEQWWRRFYPRGAILCADIDTEHWLAFGMKARVPVMVYSTYVLMSAPPVKTVARFSSEASRLRLSGLLWPEARRQWAGSAYVTRETKGKGQIIMFATDPNMRAYFWGTRKMFVNAILYGPGMTHGFEPYAEMP